MTSGDALSLPSKTPVGNPSDGSEYDEEMRSAPVCVDKTLSGPLATVTSIHMACEPEIGSAMIVKVMVDRSSQR